jgi:hypothetical protein
MKEDRAAVRDIAASFLCSRWSGASVAVSIVWRVDDVAAEVEARRSITGSGVRAGANRVQHPCQIAERSYANIVVHSEQVCISFLMLQLKTDNGYLYMFEQPSLASSTLERRAKP